MDRNKVICGQQAAVVVSLSARRAWIEIYLLMPPRSANWVALRKESVDRNKQPSGLSPVALQSLSARRAWIEISLLVYLALIR